MAESKETVLGIVEQIFQAREPASVTNRMVATVMEYLVEKIVTDGDVDELMEVVAALRTRMNEAEQRITTAEGDIDALESGKANSADVKAGMDTVAAQIFPPKGAPIAIDNSVSGVLTITIPATTRIFYNKNVYSIDEELTFDWNVYNGQNISKVVFNTSTNTVYGARRDTVLSANEVLLFAIDRRGSASLTYDKYIFSGETDLRTQLSDLTDDVAGVLSDRMSVIKMNPDAMIKSRYIQADGTFGTGSNFRCLIFNGIEEGKYGISTYLYLSGAGTKAMYVLLNTEYTSDADVNANTIVAVGPVYKQWEALSDASTTDWVSDVIDIPSEVRCVIVMYYKNVPDEQRLGLFRWENFTNISHFTGKPKKSTIIFDIGDRASLGSIGSGTEKIYILDNKAGTPLIVTCHACYTSQDDSYPTITMKCGAYTSIPYKIGSFSETVYQQWRIPPMINGIRQALVVITVPQGVTLDITDFSVQSETAVIHDSTGIRLDSHLGLQYYAPQNTKMAFSMAALCGYKACITNPMVTSDGVFICYHNGNATLNEVGQTEKISLTAEQVNSMTYAELKSNYEVSNEYFCAKIPTLDEFFSICAKTGMKPVFSVHPALTAEQWSQVKTMLMRYGLLQSLRIKANVMSTLSTAYAVLGDSIEGYMYYFSSPGPAVSTICTSFESAVPSQNVVKIIEFQTGGFSQSDVDYAISHGYLCSVWDVYGHLNGEGYKQYIAMGISGFTDDKNCCSGLLW